MVLREKGIGGLGDRGCGGWGLGNKRSCWGKGKAWFLGRRRCGLGIGLGLKEEEIGWCVGF